MEFHELIAKTVQTIHSNEATRQTLAAGLGFLRNESVAAHCLEPQLVYPCAPALGDETIAGVDSGFCVQSLHSVDLVLVRAVGVVFSFQNGSLSAARYEPGFFRFPTPFLFGQSILDLHELELSKSLVRLREEVNRARQLIETYKPAFCLLDGSLVPQYADKPPRESGLTSEYHALLAAFRGLYETAQTNNCELVGCVEDSRGNRFRSMLSQEILPSFGRHLDELESVSDSVLLQYLLNRFERSCAFSYTKQVSEHPILTDLGKWGERILACYLKPSALDRPLRIEFLHDPNQDVSAHADKIGRVITALSCLHREYAYPSVLIEADLRAKLRPEEIDLVMNKIRDRLNRSVALRLRRNSRPF